MSAGHDLGHGMVMTLARITDRSARDDGFVRLRVEAPFIARLRPRGLAPVFKIFTARTPSTPITLPTFDDNRLAVPTWESDPTRPIARAYTALDFTVGDEHLTFDALDLGVADGWLSRAEVGQTVGIIGFKHELVVDEAAHLVLVGDRSARPAIEEIVRSAPEHVARTVVTADDADELVTGAVAALEQAGERPQLWVGGEVRPVAAIREAALAHGVPQERLVTLPYWHAGLSREEYDRVLYGRYREAGERGESIGDPATAARIELTPVD